MVVIRMEIDTILRMAKNNANNFKIAVDNCDAKEISFLSKQMGKHTEAISREMLNQGQFRDWHGARIKFDEQYTRLEKGQCDCRSMGK